MTKQYSYKDSKYNNKSDLAIIGRHENLFQLDYLNHYNELRRLLCNARVLVIGGAGSIGQAVAKAVLALSPKALHVVDLSENNLAELVRDIRSTTDLTINELKTFALDAGSNYFFELLNAEAPYDFIFNLSALKHVRSEKDPYTLMRMIDVNIVNTVKIIDFLSKSKSTKYFAVSTDKAANPVNLMGASKRVMELYLNHYSEKLPYSTARFANVAFSDGSLLHGFEQRIRKQQAIAAPSDIKRYFITAGESGILCLMAALLGRNRDIFYPKLNEENDLLTFSEIATRYLNAKGYAIKLCDSEDEAKALARTLPAKRVWPCYFSPSDTTGEKTFEEFFTNKEELDTERFDRIGVIQNERLDIASLLLDFEAKIQRVKQSGHLHKEDVVSAFKSLLPEFEHNELSKNLDSKM